MKRYCYYLPFLLLPQFGRAQAPVPASAENPSRTRAWAIGLGVGNGLALGAGYRGAHWLAYGRLRGKWWGPDQEPKSRLFGDDLNTRSHQTEAALLLGYPLALGRSYFFAAAGVAYVNGRQLGAYRYSLRKTGLLSSDATHYYAYRDYQAIGLPLELGWQSPPLSADEVRVGLTAQANLNPQHSVYCILATVSASIIPRQAR